MATEPPLPNFVIIGAPRSGTTSLARHIGAHSQAFVPREKELHYFGAAHDRGTDWYRAFFTDAGDAIAVGEATPGYVYQPLAMQRMFSIIPEARLIAILRQPVDRAYSSYWMMRERNREGMSFVDAIADEPRRLAVNSQEGPARHTYLHKGRYTLHLDRVCEIYPRESLLVLLTDDLAHDPAAAFGRVCEHLGIDPLERPDGLGEPLNRHVRIRSMTVRTKTTNTTHPIGRVIRRLNVRKRSYPPIDPELRRRLTDDFEDDISRLEHWLGRDLTSWRA